MPSRCSRTSGASSLGIRGGPGGPERRVEPALLAFEHRPALRSRVSATDEPRSAVPPRARRNRTERRHDARIEHDLPSAERRIAPPYREEHAPLEAVRPRGVGQRERTGGIAQLRDSAGDPHLRRLPFEPNGLGVGGRRSFRPGVVQAHRGRLEHDAVAREMREERCAYSLLQRVARERELGIDQRSDRLLLGVRRVAARGGRCAGHGRGERRDRERAPDHGLPQDCISGP